MYTQYALKNYVYPDVRIMALNRSRPLRRLTAQTALFFKLSCYLKYFASKKLWCNYL